MNIYNETNNVIIHETSVDFVLRPCFKEIHVVQFDKTLPVVKVELFKNGEKYIIPDEAAINIRFGKLDHTFVMKPVLGCNEERTAVYFEVDEQMTVIAGRVSPVLEMVIGSNIAYSSPIGFVIDKNPVQMSDVESATVVYPVIYELIGTVNQFESRISALESQLVDLDSLESRVDTLEGNVTAWNAKYDKPVTGIPASDLADLDASKITSGTFSDARIASASVWNAKYDKPATGIPASDLAETYVVANNAITSGTHTKITYDAKGLVTGGSDLAASDIPDLDTSKITSGTFAVARIPNLSASKITSGTFSDARIASASVWNAKYDKPANGIPASDLAETYIIANNFNIQNGAGINAIQEKMVDATVNFVGRNQNAEALDPTISATINTGASGNQSAAFGKNTMSLATASFTNGNKTLAKGEESHAEGYQSVALGNGSHAEGTSTTAYSEASHSEGSGTVAHGLYSHAEGVNNWSNGESSHAEGDNNESNGYGSHVEGAYAYTGDEENIPSSRPEDTSGGGSGGSGGDGGSSTVNKQGNGAHAEGFYTVAIGNYSHSEGYVSDAIGLGSHAEGGWNTASGELSHAEGKHNTASGYCSHVAGLYNTAGNAYQTVIGRYNSNKNNTVFEIGWGESELNRKNVFEVYQDGHAEVGLMGTTNNSVVTRQFVNSIKGTKLYKHTFIITGVTGNIVALSTTSTKITSLNDLITLIGGSNTSGISYFNWYFIGPSTMKIIASLYDSSNSKIFGYRASDGTNVQELSISMTATLTDNVTAL